MMKNRALRRHQQTVAKKRRQKAYNSCIGNLPWSERQDLENNVQKLRKVCVSSHLEEEFKAIGKKPIQERKHDISMREQLN